MNSGYYGLLANAPEDPRQSTGSGDDTSPMQTENSTKKEPKPPPIILPGSSYNDVIKHVGIALPNTTNISYKITDGDTRILAQTSADFIKIKDHLIKNKVPFCTHPLRSEKRVKICLYGLIEMKCETLKAELNKQNVNVAEIKMISPKSGYKGEARIYILYFNKEQKIKIADLRSKVTGIQNLRVKFQYYSPKKFGPTQCVKCQGLGHGALNCNLTTRCVTCAGEHESKQCPHRKPVTPTESNPNPKPKAPDSVVKCALCHENHTANYSKCPIRQQFEKSVKKIKAPKLSRPAPTLDYEQFPPLTPNQPSNLWSNQLPTWQTQNNDTQISKIIEMQMQMMQSFQLMQQEMFSAVQNMLQEVKSLIFLINHNNKPTEVNKDD